MLSRNGNDTQDMYKYLLRNNSEKPVQELREKLPSLSASFDYLSHILPYLEQPLLEKIGTETDAALLQQGLTACKKMIKQALEQLTKGKAHHFATECKIGLKNTETPETIFLGNEKQPTNFQHFKKIFSLEDNSQFESLLNTYNALVTRLSTLAKAQQNELMKSKIPEKDIPSETGPRFGF